MVQGSADCIMMQYERVNMALGQKCKCRLLSFLYEYQVVLVILDRDEKKNYSYQSPYTMHMKECALLS